LPGTPPRKLFEDKLPAELQRDHATEFVSYALEVMNDRGRSAGASNQVRVPVAPALAAPAELKARVTAEGVSLAWSGTAPSSASKGLQYAYRVSRRLKGAKEEIPVGTVPLNGASFEYLDRSFEWEKEYEYHVTGVTEVRHEDALVAEVDGDDSPTVTVVAHDTFPPTQPGGVQAVFSGPGQRPFIDLTWAPNLEPDLADTTSIAGRKARSRKRSTRSLRKPRLSATNTSSPAVNTTTPSARSTFVATRANAQPKPARERRSR
jgi:hypothetical protein